MAPRSAAGEWFYDGERDRSVAIALASHGSRVVVNHNRSAAEAEQVVATVRGMGGMAVTVRADVSNPHEAKSLIKAAEDHFGAIGVLVNNAGVSVRKDLEELETRDWEETLRTNLFRIPCHAGCPARDAWAEVGTHHQDLVDRGSGRRTVSNGNVTGQTIGINGGRYMT
jgi:NAD(P)-dependent dehydrogenase (short-subunit alcohol dehydrogenase family)